MADTDIIYKVTVLSLLKRADLPLKNRQVVDFFLDYNLTDYFHAQAIIGDLLDSGLIREDKTHNATVYHLSEDGENAYESMKEKLTAGISDDIKAYLSDNGGQMKKENSVTSRYRTATSGGYDVILKASEEDREIISLTVNVPGKAEAEALCYNWKVRYTETYLSLIEMLK